jgi:hypothetical protein
MLKVKSTINRSFAAMGAAFTMGTLFATDAHASAPTGGFNDIANKIVGGISGLPGLLTALAYMMGLLFSVLGVLKIKDHVENPTQTQLKDGAIRLAVGGALFLIPVVTSAMQELVDTGDGAINPGAVNKLQFEVK